MPDGDLPPLFGVGQRLPPSNIQAEQALLGALLTNNARVVDRCQFLRPEHFADPVNGRIFQQAMKRIESGQVADALTLKTDLENAGVLDEVGGVKYLTGLITANVGWMVSGDYAKVVYDTWMRRQLMDVGQEIVDRAFGAEVGIDPNVLVSDAAESVLALGESGTEKRGTNLGAAALVATQKSEAAHRGASGFSRLDTGIRSVDGIWNGLWPADLTYLMARSRTGKSPLMMQIARHVAQCLVVEAETTKQQMGHVHIFSLEMSADALATTNLASTTRWTADQIRSGDIGGPQAWEEFRAAADDLGRLPIVIDDAADMDLPTLIMRARATLRQRRTRLICIDYRELVRRGRDQSRMQLPEWIPYLGYQLKALAKTCNVPVIALAQINKSRDNAETPRPTLNDLPYDGGQAADAVFALHRAELYMTDEAPGIAPGLAAEKAANIKSAWEAKRREVAGVAEFLALKRRFGPANVSCKLSFNGPRMRFGELRPADYGLPMNEDEYDR